MASAKRNIEDQPSQTLARALQVLEAFDTHQPEWGVRELGRKLELNPTTVHRIVATFLNAGYLEQNPETSRYSLGPKVVKLASLYAHQNPLSKIARRVFETYADRFEHNFYLGALNNYEMVYLAALDGRGPIKVVADIGGTTALHSIALGKILLAFQDDEYIQGYIDSTGLPAYSSLTITETDILWQEIREIRKQRYAINKGEHFEQVGAVGVPIQDALGRVTLAVSLAYPQHLVSQEHLSIEDIISLAQEVAEEISRMSA
jgi:DNA-binding IclR family transcriptional regulator